MKALVVVLAIATLLVANRVSAAPPPDVPVTGGGAVWEFESPSDGTVFRVRSNVGIDLAAPVTTSFDDRAFSYFGTWNEYIAPTPDATKYGIGDHWTDTTNATTGFIFTGTQVRFYSAKANFLGIAEYRVDDGTPFRVDLYAASNADQQLVFDSGALAPAIHRVTVKNTGTRNAQSSLNRVSVDRVDVVGGKLVAALVP